MRARDRKAGMTLPEILVVSFLLTLAMAMMAMLFSSATRITRAAEGRSDQSSDRLKVASRLRQAMLNSYQSGNTVFYRGGDPDDLVLSVISTYDSHGKRDWNAATQSAVFHGYEIFYREPSDDSLRWCRVDIPESKVAEPLSESAILAALSSQDRTLLDSIVTFQLCSLVDGAVLDGWANPLGLRLVQQTPRATKMVTEIPFKFPSL